MSFVYYPCFARDFCVVVSFFADFANPKRHDAGVIPAIFGFDRK
jgi:hypothetical protein